jgi:hypothetical protein
MRTSMISFTGPPARLGAGPVYGVEIKEILVAGVPGAGIEILT